MRFRRPLAWTLVFIVMATALLIQDLFAVEGWKLYQLVTSGSHYIRFHMFIALGWGAGAIYFLSRSLILLFSNKPHGLKALVSAVALFGLAIADLRQANSGGPSGISYILPLKVGLVIVLIGLLSSGLLARLFRKAL